MIPRERKSRDRATARNYLVGNEFVPLTTNLGVSLAVANNEITDGATHVIPGIGDVGTPFAWPRIVRQLERKLGRRLSHSDASRYLTGQALRFIGENPGRFARLLWRKSLLFWGPVEIRNLKEIHYARSNSPVLRIIPGNFSLVMALAVVGIMISFLRFCKGHAPTGELSGLETPPTGKSPGSGLETPPTGKSPGSGLETPPTDALLFAGGGMRLPRKIPEGKCREKREFPGREGSIPPSSAGV